MRPYRHGILDQVAAYVASFDSVTTAEVAGRFSITGNHASQILHRLLERGVVERIEKGVYRKATS